MAATAVPAGAQANPESVPPAAVPAAPAAPAPAAAAPAPATPPPAAAQPAAPAAAVPAAKAPATYALTLPAGGRLDADDVKHIETLARHNDWTNEDAQAALAEYDANVQAQSERFLTGTKADADYGGERLVESQRLAALAIAKIRPEGHPRRETFLKFLNRGGAGNHIEVVSFLADLGKLIGEDAPATGRSTSGGTRKDAATTLYDHPTSRALDSATG